MFVPLRRHLAFEHIQDEIPGRGRVGGGGGFSGHNRFHSQKIQRQRRGVSKRQKNGSSALSLESGFMENAYKSFAYILYFFQTKKSQKPESLERLASVVSSSVSHFRTFDTYLRTPHQIMSIHPSIYPSHPCMNEYNIHCYIYFHTKNLYEYENNRDHNLQSIKFRMYHVISTCRNGGGRSMVDLVDLIPLLLLPRVFE